jgi:TolB protein
MASGQILNLTRDASRNFGPVWSPDGSKLLYLSTRQIRVEIRILDLTTGRQRYLTDLFGVDTYTPQWSRDSRRVVFATDQDIYLADTDTGDLRNLSSHPALDTAPIWSPDEEHIAFVSRRDGDDEIYLVNLATGDVRNLTNQPEHEVSPTWSPDGAHIAFLSYHDQNMEIYMLDVSSGQTRNITADAANDFMPSWTRDGQLRFLSDRSGDLTYYQMNWDGSGLHPLFRFDLGSTDLHWSPDGQRLAFASNRDGNSDIYVVQVGTDTPHNLTHNPAADTDPQWRPSG